MVRMWDVDPKVMCQRHLLGEHYELHMMVGMLRDGRSLRGMISNGILQIDKMQERHDILVEEFRRRKWQAGTNHKTPLEQPDHREYVSKGSVHPLYSLLELLRRCPDCRQIYDSSPILGAEAKPLLAKYGIQPATFKWEGLMIAWKDTTGLHDPYHLSNVLVKEQEEILRKKANAEENDVKYEVNNCRVK